MTSIFNEKHTVDLLQRLVEIPSPSGYTENVMELIAQEFDAIGVPHRKTNKGAIIATIEGTDTPTPSPADSTCRYTWRNGEGD